MDTGSALRAMIDRSGISARAISEASGRSSGWLSNCLSRGSSPSLATAADLAAPCGYSVALVPTGDLPASALVIDPHR